VGRDACDLSIRWKIDLNLARGLVALDEWAARKIRAPGIRWPGLFIISGFRTPEQNRAAGGAPNSEHLECPAMAADLRVGTVEGIESSELWAILGNRWKLTGGRWGGDFGWEGSPFPNPREWNHFAWGLI